MEEVLATKQYSLKYYLKPLSNDNGVVYLYLTSIVKLFIIPIFHMTIRPVPSCICQKKYVWSDSGQRLEKNRHDLIDCYNLQTLLFCTLNLQPLNENYKRKNNFINYSN